ncbi:MAG: choice-of-anchor tandem repeat NxxGxxAF-containing protein [Bacteroidales bacterium]
MKCRLARSGIVGLVLALGSCAPADAQVQLVPLVTDETPLPLSNKFGVAGATELNQRGDYAFIGAGSSALFLRRAGAAAPTRLFQMLDEVPSYPGSRVDLINEVRMNEAGLVAFSAELALQGGNIYNFIFVSDGVSLRRIVGGPDPAPGGNGALYERGISLVGLNDAGDIAFTAPLVPTNSGVPVRTTLYMVPAGGSAVRLVGLDDPAPGMTQGEKFSSLSPIRLNNRGDVLFSANLAGGSGGSGLFIAGRNGALRKVVANGDPRGGGATFSSPAGGLLNNAGQVIFFANSAIWLNASGAGNAVVAEAGDAVPAPFDGTLGGNPTGDLSSPAAFNDDGVVVFTSPVRNSSLTGFALFRATQGMLEILAYNRQPAPGAAGLSFGGFSAVSINSSGVVSFRAGLRLDPSTEVSSFAIYRQANSAPTPPQLVVADGQPAPLGATYSLYNSAGTKILDSGAVYLWADLPGGSADFAEVLVSTTDTRVLMSTAEELPDGARISLRGFQPGASGNLVGTTIQRTGGRRSILLHDTRSGSTDVVVTDGDQAPGGGVLRISTTSTVFINSSGNLAFRAQVVGGPFPIATAILLRTSSEQLQKIVASGDFAGNFAGNGRWFEVINISSLLPKPFNDAGQVVFSSSLSGISTAPAGLFVGAAGTAPVKVALVGDAPPGLGTIQSFVGMSAVSINEAGHVLFLATTIDTGGLQRRGLYFWTPEDGVSLIRQAGDRLDGRPEWFTNFSFPALNNHDEVAFIATLGGGQRGVVLAGPASGPLATLAMDGDPAPGGGTYSIAVSRPDATLNDAGDIVFRAELAGGTAKSGYFVRRGRAGQVHALIRQGDTAPGTAGVFGWIATTLNNYLAESFRLAPTGDLAVQALFEEPGGMPTPGMWYVRPDDTIEPIVLRGKTSPAFEGGRAVTTVLGNTWAGGRRIPVSVVVSGGQFAHGVLLAQSMTVTATPSVLWPPDSTLVPIAVTFDLGHTCDANPVVRLVSVASNEPLSPGDIEGAVLGSDDRSFRLRAIRQGTGYGRVYTITYSVSDSCGTATGAAQVFVPHDARKQ